MATCPEFPTGSEFNRVVLFCVFQLFIVFNCFGLLFCFIIYFPLFKHTKSPRFRKRSTPPSLEI